MPLLPGLLAAIFLSGLAAGALAQPSPEPRRIASLNLCTDLLLLELVPRERIVSLSYWAADTDLSYLAREVGDIPLNHSLAEEIVPLQPDLVLAGQFSDTKVINLLRRMGYRVEVLEVPLTLAGMREHILDFGRLVNAAREAELLAAELDRRLALVSTRARTDRGERPLAVVYGPQGVSPGRDTLMDDLLQLAGFRNLAAELDIVSYGTLSLEALVQAEPDLLILDDLSANRDSVAHQALRHPALVGQFRPEQVISLPPSLTACVGPTSVGAAERLLRVRLGE
jgi:iron complex transport system substrate-binding protein